MTAETPTDPEPKARRRLPEERPRQILEAALSAFGELGLANATLDDIARRAGVAKGTIYLYFANKEELFREVVRDVVVRTLERAERGPVSATATEALTGFLGDYWRFLRSSAFQTVHRLVSAELHQFPDLAEFYGREVITRSMALITGLIGRGVDSGEFRAVDPAVAARMLASMTMTHATWCERRHLFKHVCDATDDAVLAEITDFYLHALCPPAKRFAHA